MAVLLLRLAAPLQSWGQDSKFEKRMTGSEPTKSGVIGLLAAALGVRRNDAQALSRLDQLRFAVRVDQEGELLADYHTASTEEDRAKGKTTYITRRYYLADAVFLAALESDDTAFLRELAEALRHPVFPLFLGRRSCPPTMPVCLGIREGTLLEALEMEPAQAPAWRRQRATRLRVVMDAANGERGAVPRKDLPVSFSPVSRQYSYRQVRETTLERPASPVEDTAHDPFQELR